MKLIRLILMVFVTIFCDAAMGQYALPSVIDTATVQVDQQDNYYLYAHRYVPNPDGLYLLAIIKYADDSMQVVNGLGIPLQLQTIFNSEPGYTVGGITDDPVIPGFPYYFLLRVVGFTDLPGMFSWLNTQGADSSSLVYDINGSVVSFIPNVSTGLVAQSPSAETDLITWNNGTPSVLLNEADDVFVRDVSGRTLWQGRLPQGQHQLPRLASTGMLVVSTSSGRYQKILGL